MGRAVSVLWAMLALSSGLAAQGQSVFATRQGRAYDRLGSGLLILRSRWSPPHLALPRFEQDASFYYFTGADRLLGAILVLDGASRRAELFLPAAMPGPILGLIAAGQPAPAAARIDLLHVDHIGDWSAFPAFVDARLATDPRLSILMDDGGDAAAFTGALGTPLDSGFALDNGWALWRIALQKRWPHASIARDTIAGALRTIKDADEIATLRRVGAASAAALKAGLREFKAGARQRAVEAAVVTACVRYGAGGPSFWPWAMSGANSSFPRPFASLLDLHHLDRVMRAGEIVRFDLGCEVDHYMGDVGRTVPVSGTFDSGQREVVNLLVAAYRAGLARMRDGATVDDVIAASMAEAARLRPTMRTDLGRRAAAVITQRDSIPFWEVHGIGLEAAERFPGVLHSGMVVDYEPIFSLGEQGFYMEDMILITPTGYEILTRGLPYTAAEIEQAMRRP